MSWLTRIKDSLLNKIKKKIPKKDIEDIEKKITDIADIIIDHGLRKYHFYQQSSTLLNVETFEVVRRGSNYEIIADICKRRFDIDLVA